LNHAVMNEKSQLLLAFLWACQGWQAGSWRESRLN